MSSKGQFDPNQVDLIIAGALQQLDWNSIFSLPVGRAKKKVSKFKLFE
jgi:hypothetical protein